MDYLCGTTKAGSWSRLSEKGISRIQSIPLPIPPKVRTRGIHPDMLFSKRTTKMQNADLRESAFLLE